MHSSNRDSPRSRRMIVQATRCKRPFDSKEQPLPIFAVKKIANCSPPFLVYFALCLAFFRAQATLVARLHSFRSAALRTAVSKPGFIRFQLKFFTANDADFDWKRHQVDDKTSQANKLSGPFALRYGNLFDHGREKAMINAHQSLPPTEGRDAGYSTKSSDC